MENKTVEQLLAMSQDEIDGLSAQQKANRTKTINAAKAASPNSGALANSAIAAAAQQSNPAGSGTKSGDDAQALENARLKKEAFDKDQQALKEKEAAAANAAKLKEQQANEAKLKKEQEDKDAAAAKLKEDEAKRLQEEKERLAKEQEEQDNLKSNDEEAKLLAKYGAGYVKAKRGSVGTYFSAIAWGLLGANKEGWVPDIKVPDEVANFKKGGQ